MKFRIDDNLAAIAIASGKTPEFVSTELCRAYIEAGIIDGDSGNWGEPFFAVETDNSSCYKVAAIAQEVLGTCFGMTTKIYDLILLGDGDCPYCGGKLEYAYNEGHHKMSHDPYDEPEYIVDTRVYRCDTCGEEIYQSVDDEPDREEEWAMQRYEEKHNINL